MPAKKPKKILVYRPAQDENRYPGWKDYAGERVYASREAVRLPGGMIAPAPDSWELASDVPIRVADGITHFPDHELEPTAQGPGRIKFCYRTLYDRDGREASAPYGDTFVLPHHLGPEIFFGDVVIYTVVHWPWLNPKG